MDIFAGLEENNLLEIERMQEGEEELEALKSKKKAMQAEFAEQMATLKTREVANNLRME